MGNVAGPSRPGEEGVFRVDCRSVCVYEEMLSIASVGVESRVRGGVLFLRSLRLIAVVYVPLFGVITIGVRGDLVSDAIEVGVSWTK